MHYHAMGELVGGECLVPLGKKDSGRVFECEHEFTKLIHCSQLVNIRVRALGLHVSTDLD